MSNGHSKLVKFHWALDRCVELAISSLNNNIRSTKRLLLFTFNHQQDIVT